MGGRLGVVLAAGAGSRMGTPKALLRTQDGEAWVALAARMLADGGCADVLVVLGASAEAAAACLPSGVSTTVATRWAHGLGESLAAGIRAAQAHPGRPDVLVIHLVDAPGITVDAIRRTVERAGDDLAVLARATYDGVSGHPVVIGRAHWNGVLSETSGDRGAGNYLKEHGCLKVECGDVADGRDVDTPDELYPRAQR
jgi:CTP:molybdopterin cytidylyltransferase MocA